MALAPSHERCIARRIEREPGAPEASVSSAGSCVDANAPSSEDGRLPTPFRPREGKAMNGEKEAEMRAVLTDLRALLFRPVTLSVLPPSACANSP